MTVFELIEKLQQLPQDDDVVVLCADGYEFAAEFVIGGEERRQQPDGTYKTVNIVIISAYFRNFQ